jgi:hypothetical protein
MDALVNTVVSLRADFMSALGSLVPDANSVYWSLYAHDGSLLTGPTLITTTPTDTGVTIPINSSHQTIGAGKRFEKRQVIVTWTTGGQGHTWRTFYRVLPITNYSVSKDDVRSLLGLNADELLDEEIDLFAAFLTVEDDISQATLAAALSSGTLKETSANLLIEVTAAIAVIPSLRLRTPMTTSDGGKSWQRFRTPPDWDAITGELAARRASLVATVTDTLTAGAPLAIFTQPTDVITG